MYDEICRSCAVMMSVFAFIHQELMTRRERAVGRTPMLGNP